MAKDKMGRAHIETLQRDVTVMRARLYSLENVIKMLVGQDPTLALAVPAELRPAMPREPQRPPHAFLPEIHPQVDGWWPSGGGLYGKDFLASSDIDMELPEVATAAEPVVTYQIPGAPPIGRRVEQRRVDILPPPEGKTEAIRIEHVRQWQRTPVGDFVEVFMETGNLDTGNEISWIPLLHTYGPLNLVPLTPEELASEELYGPVGARWGDPNQPCPFRGTFIDDQGETDLHCALGLRHAGPHKDKNGAPLGVTEETPMAARLNAGVLANLGPFCDCGHPEQHRRGCPRYAFGGPE